MLFDVKKEGVFALVDFAKGQSIHMLNGKFMNTSQMLDEVKNGNLNINDPLQIGPNFYMILDEISNSFRHSCEPNCGIRKSSELIAIQDIKIGDELTFDYSLTVMPNIRNWSMPCYCNKTSCRKIISDITSIPRHKLMKYVRTGAIQDYIRLLLHMPKLYL